MDAHFANQIGQETIRTHNAVAFGGPARQYGCGGLGAFAMRMGRVAIPLVKQYVMPVAKEFGKNLLSSFVPEISNVISGRKRPKAVLGKSRKQRSKNHCFDNIRRRCCFKKLMLAHIHQKTNCKCIWDCATGCHAAAGGAGRAMEPAGTAQRAGRCLGGEHETIKWKKSWMG